MLLPLFCASITIAAPKNFDLIFLNVEFDNLKVPVDIGYLI